MCVRVCGVVVVIDKVCSYDNGYYCPLCSISLTTGSLSTMEGCHSQEYNNDNTFHSYY